MTTFTRILTATTVAGALAAAGGVLIGTAQAGAPGSADPAAPGTEKVATVHYTLGDAAFQVPGFHRDAEKPELADLELTGIVHYPQRLAGGPRPVVVLSHGLQDTCADRNAPPRPAPSPPPEGSAPGGGGAAGLGVAGEAELDPLLRWPCAEGVPSLPSYRGYDYLGRHLASRGFVTVSISANGVNAGEQGDPADRARAALINKHLAMWSQLTTTGGGPLAGKFTDPGSSTPRRVDFRGKLDMSRVGTLGHSRGGRGVMWHAAEKHRAEWPRGVQVKAVLPLAPAGIFNPDDPEVVANYQLTSIPFLQWEGMCDYGAHGEYFDATAKQNRAVSRELRVHGANHNFLNTEWSPSSGQVSSYDDADYGRRPAPGQCTTTLGEETAERQLTEDEERRIATGYVSAFFRRYLTGDTRMDPILDGKQLPYSGVTGVDARIQAR